MNEANSVAADSDCSWENWPKNQYDIARRLIWIIPTDLGAVHFVLMLRSIGQISRAAALGLFALVGSYSSAMAQPTSAPSASPLGPEQLDRLVAPIALYPDPLIAQILIAATYPQEIVEADRWLQIPGNAALKGDELTAKLQNESWDPSIKSLALFPQLLHLMHTNLDWTEQLGDAFLAQQAEVMDAIQRLRERARAAGSLSSTPQQTVSTEENEISIEPANPEIIYVPSYNPWCAYGAWPYADYPPFYFGSWGGVCEPTESFVVFGVGIYPAFAFWAWGHCDWRHHHIRVDPYRLQQFRGGHEPPHGIWQHDPAHRHGVPYRDPETAARFLGAAYPAQREPRGFAPAAPPAPTKTAKPSVGQRPAEINAPAAARTLPLRPGPPAFESFGRGEQVRGEAARGFSSRMAPVAPAPSFHAAPMPSFQAAPTPSFHGGVGHR